MPKLLFELGYSPSMPSKNQGGSMAIVVKKCPHCKKSYQSGPPTVELGTPLRICDNCFKSFIDKSRTEWELKSSLSRFLYFFSGCYTALLYGTWAPISYFIYMDINRGNTNNVTAIALYICSVMAILVCFIRRLKPDIEESNKRMANPGYRETLKELGLLD